MKFAVIETGGKQYRVSAGQTIQVEKLTAEAGGGVSFKNVLLIADGDKTDIGTPYVKGAIVEAKVLRDARARKVIVFKYHSKTRYRKKKGHRQHFTEVEITKV
ncbi:MAG: hypothetical protein RL681_574 [Candidatus Parcubacteria bacterium]|jgi:large subunit ribosomal protein L21